MYKSGLAIITKGLTENNLKIIYQFANNCINNRLYVSIKGFSPYNGDWKNNIKTCYNIANKICPGLDVRLLLPYSGNHVNDRDISVILCDDSNLKYENITHVVGYVTKTMPKVFLNIEGHGEILIESPKIQEPNFVDVCLGGTFDRLHNGHKILLSISALMTKKKLFCGVSADDLLKDKFLFELIEPLNIRIGNCLSFLRDINPELSYTVLSINHPFGPAADNPDFDCIIGSKETTKGCEKINESRLKKGFKPLHVELIEMVDDNFDEDFNEISDEMKVSSTKSRLKLLGQTLKSPVKSHIRGKPYVIGLTGGIASGKSSISKNLKSFGAEVIDCDLLGHDAYAPGSDCFNEIVSVFGDRVVNTDTGMINRAAVGAIVFNNPVEMKKLTDIVWPAIVKLAKARIGSIEEMMQKKNLQHFVVVIDAAVLLDAGWDQICNEVWVSFVPRAEAIERLKNRNKLSETEASSRIDSQKPNKYYVDSAHVAFCTLWSYEFSLRQLKVAWSNLLGRLNAQQSL